MAKMNDNIELSNKENVTTAGNNQSNIMKITNQLQQQIQHYLYNSHRQKQLL